MMIMQTRVRKIGTNINVYNMIFSALELVFGRTMVLLLKELPLVDVLVIFTAAVVELVEEVVDPVVDSVVDPVVEVVDPVVEDVKEEVVPARSPVVLPVVEELFEVVVSIAAVVSGIPEVVDDVVNPELVDKLMVACPVVTGVNTVVEQGYEYSVPLITVKQVRSIRLSVSHLDTEVNKEMITMMLTIEIIF